MIYRQATIADVHQLVYLNRLQYPDITWDSVSQTDSWETGLWWADSDLLSWYFSVLERTGGGIMVAVSGTEIIGELDYCQTFDNIAEFKGNRAHIIWIYVHPSYRKLGVATGLIELLRSRLDNPIWVEPEDHRSDSLYSKLGRQIHSISNWEMTLPEIGDEVLDQRLDYEEVSYPELLDQYPKFQLLLGRYYAPLYDILQLQLSEPVSAFMWGNTEPARVHRYHLQNTDVIAIVTQYPRIWVNSDYNSRELRRIVGAICLHIFELGFDEIYFQIYNGDMNAVVSDLGFRCTIEEDPVYEI